MALPAAVQQQIIVDKLGDVPTPMYPSGILAGMIANIWHLYDHEPNAAVHYLLATREAVDVLIGVCRNDVTFKADTLSVNLTDKLKFLEALRPTDADIQRAYKLAQGSGYASGQLKTTAPTTPPYPWPDANNPALLGTPYRYLPWPWGG